jgi:hypothetical protein
LAEAAAPSNDNFANGAAISPPPSSASGSTIGATTQSGEPRPCDTGATVWYRLSVSEATTVVADTYGSDYDTVLAAYQGTTLSTLDLLECNDDTFGLQSEVAFDAVPGQTYHIQVGGYESDRGGYELALSAGEARAAISGRITAPDGSPLDGCVEVYDADDPWSWHGDAETDPATGAYEIGQLGSGEYKVYAYDCWWPREFVGMWYRSAADFDEADRVTVVSGQDTTGIDLALPSGGSISGRVTGGAGEPLADICVDVYSLDGEFWISGADTLADGSYAAGGILGGAYKVEFTDCYEEELPGEWYNDKRDFDAADLVSVSDGIQTPGIDAVLEVVGGITGRVRNAQNASLQGVCVSAYRGGSAVASLTTGSDGRYTFPSLPEGAYQLFIDPCGNPDVYAPEWFNDRRQASLADTVTVIGDQVITANVTLERWGRIRGLVTDHAGEPVAATCVDAYQQEGVSLGQAVTSSLGEYELGGLAQGTYRIRFSSCDGSGTPLWYRDSLTFAGADPVQVQLEQVVTGIDASLQGPAILVEQTGGGTEIGESGLTDTLSVKLATRPDAEVRVDLDSGAGQDALVSSGSLVFDEDSWSDPQEVSLGAQNDCSDDPDRTLDLGLVATSQDPAYEGLVTGIPVLVRDNDESTALQHLGPGSVVRGTSATLQASLTMDGGEPVPGRTVTFRSSGDELGSAGTDQDGVARLDVPVDQPYGTWDVEIGFDGDCNEASPQSVELGGATAQGAIAVVWEHEFADGGRTLRVNTITGEIQFAAPGDVSAIHTDPAMEVRQLPTGEKLIEIQYTDQDLTVAGRFLPARGIFGAVVRTPADAYLLTGLP